MNEKQMQAIENLNQRLFKAQEEYQREVGVVDEMKQALTVLNSQLKVRLKCFLLKYVSLLANTYKTI